MRRSLSLMLVAVFLVAGCMPQLVDAPTPHASTSTTSSLPTFEVIPDPGPSPVTTSPSVTVTSTSSSISLPTSPTPTPSPTSVPITTPPPPPSGPVIGDSFEGTVLDTSKWFEQSFNEGRVAQDGRLVLTVSGNRNDSKAQLFTRNRWLGDFDVQIDFEAGSGWMDNVASTSPGAHLDLAAMGVFIDESHWIFINMTANSGFQELMVYSSFPGQGVLSRLPNNAANGKLRIVRNGSSVTFRHDSGPGWADMYTISNLDVPVFLYLYSGSTGTAHAFTTYFDNFVINSSAGAPAPFAETPLFPAAPPRTVTPAPSWGPTPQLPPVRVGRNGFEINSEPFRFIGANSPNFGFYDGYGLSIEKAIASASQAGVKVLRIYLWFGDRPWAGTLEAMDMVLDAAARNGVYIIAVLTDLCPPRSDLTKDEYFRILPHGDLASQPSLDSFKDVVRTLLNRKNTVNGRVYKDDSTIMAWDIANEPVLQYFDPSTVNMWLNQVADFIKSLDQDHLVTLGASGWLGDVFDKGKAYYEALNVPELDFFSFHMYPPSGYSPPAAGGTDEYLDAIATRTRTMLSMGKPVVLEEFGFTSYRNLVASLGREPNDGELQQWLKVYKDQMDVVFAAGASGAMFWGWGVPETRLVPLWWRDEDHDSTETSFVTLIRDYVIPESRHR